MPAGFFFFFVVAAAVLLVALVVLLSGNRSTRGVSYRVRCADCGLDQDWRGERFQTCEGCTRRFEIPNAPDPRRRHRSPPF